MIITKNSFSLLTFTHSNQSTQDKSKLLVFCIKQTLLSFLFFDKLNFKTKVKKVRFFKWKNVKMLFPISFSN